MASTPEQLDTDLARYRGRLRPLRVRHDGATRVRRSPATCGPRARAGGAFGEGARSQGLDVIDLGLASTDLTYFASGHLDAPAAMFTASHNPAGYNGIKMCLRREAHRRGTGLREIKAPPRIRCLRVDTHRLDLVARPPGRLRSPRAVVRRRPS